VLCEEHCIVLHDAIGASNRRFDARLPTSLRVPDLTSALSINVNPRLSLHVDRSLLKLFAIARFARPPLSVHRAIRRRRPMRRLRPARVARMLRRKSLILRLFGIVSWTAALAMVFTVILRARTARESGQAIGAPMSAKEPQREL
jgi:hypothetical protein